MSKCISSEGEYSDHELAEQPRFMCARCFVFDEDAALAALDTAEGLAARTRGAYHAALARAEAAEAAIERVRALIEEWEHVGALGGPFPDRVIVDVDCEVIEPLRAALAPVTEEGGGE